MHVQHSVWKGCCLLQLCGLCHLMAAGGADWLRRCSRLTGCSDVQEKTSGVRFAVLPAESEPLATQERDTKSPPNHFLNPVLWSNANSASVVSMGCNVTLCSLQVRVRREKKHWFSSVSSVPHKSPCLSSAPSGSFHVWTLGNIRVSECSRKLEECLAVPLALVAEDNAAFGLQGLWTKSHGDRWFKTAICYLPQSLQQRSEGGVFCLCIFKQNILCKS